MDWMIYRGAGSPHDDITRLPPPPPWRVFNGGPPLPTPSHPIDEGRIQGEIHRAATYQPEHETVELVNAAIYLRRPLLVTGHPGTGKSTLAYSIARELRLGPVLHWPVTSKTTLRDGLYQYDPLARLNMISSRGVASEGVVEDDLGRFLRLGPLGTALLPFERPRVLLIDEVDKGDLDLPNDLLTIFEKGEYEIPELIRISESQPQCGIPVSDSLGRVTVTEGLVRSRAFPIVVMTSNGEREFPPAFLRRCVSLRLKQPGAEQLQRIVRAHLGSLADSGLGLIERFLERRSTGGLATDQLLNAIYLVHQAELSADQEMDATGRNALADQAFSYLSQSGDLDSSELSMDND